MILIGFPGQQNGLIIEKMLINLLLRNHKVDEADILHVYDISLYINCVFIPVG